MTTGTASQMQLRQSCFLLVHILGAQRCFGDGTGAAVRCGPAEQKVLGLASMLAHQKETGKRRPPPQSGRVQVTCASTVFWRHQWHVLPSALSYTRPPWALVYRGWSVPGRSV
jgi:hypothetical protein